jgi:hypothetical protein
VTVRYGTTLDPALRRAAERVIGLAASWGALDPAGPGEALLVGADDPNLAAGRDAGPLVLLPAVGPARPARWAAALVASADAVALLDPAEALALGAVLRDRSVLLVGLTPPAAGPEERGVQAMGAPASARAAWLAEEGAFPDDGPGVRWIWGRGAAPLAAAAEAWTAGRAVVALPGTIDHELLRRGGALRADTPLEALEATRYVRSAPPLAGALAARGRAALSLLPTPEESAVRLCEAVEVGRAEGG